MPTFFAMPWFKRTFPDGLTPEMLPGILERLRGAPARVEEKAKTIPHEKRIARLQEAWSIQENLGHLVNLEPLHHGRVEELVAGTPTLRPADPENRATWDARHNECPVVDIVRTFRIARERFVARIEACHVEMLRRTALHPRLKIPMNIVDLAFFVAEHDDHHLARATELSRLVTAVKIE